MSSHILLFLFTFFLSSIFTPIVRQFAIKYNLVSLPRDDRWHKKPTALLGGSAIFLVFITAFLILRPVLTLQIIGLLLGGTFIFICGLLDDIIHHKAQTKLLLQIIASCIAVLFGITFRFGNNPLLLMLISIIWIVGITNSINLLDNMDGLACGIAGISFMFIFVSSVFLKNDGISLISLILAGASLGFLPYNFNPARIFMGDSGSMFLGFSLACITLMGGSIHIPNLIATLAIPVLILAVPIFDTSLVTLLRIFQGRSILKGGKDHVSHRLVSLGLSERKAVTLLYFLSIVFGLVALLYSKIDVIIVTLLSALTIVVLLFFGIFLSEIETHKDTQIEKEKLRKIKEGKVILNTFIFNKRMIVEVLVDVVLICVAYYSAYLLRYDGKLNETNLSLIKNSLPWIIVIRLLCFWHFGLYRGIWRYISINDLISIFKAVSLSSGLMILLLTFQFRFGEYSRVVFVIDWLLVLFLLTSIRIFLRTLDESFANYRLGKKKILIIGAGDTGELVLREVKRNHSLNYNPIGFIDDDQSKVGRAIHGVPVLGTRKDISGIVKESGIDEIIIAIPSIPEESLRELFDICSACSVPYREIYGMFNDAKG